MNKNVQDRIASKERRFISDREKPLKTPPKTVIMCIGMVRTGVWSRIKGHAKRSGGQFRRVVPVAMTNEFMSSQTCCYCFNTIDHPNKRKLNRRQYKIAANNGTSICINPKCPSYQAGKNCQNRDVQASKCIAIAAASRLLTGRTLA
jgi:hypothetical protein